MAETIREMVIRMTMDAGGFRKSADEAKRQINLLNGELKAAGSASDGTANKLKLLGEKLNIQKGQVDNYAKAVEQAKKNLANANTEADKLAKARNLSKLESDLNKAKSAAKATADEINKINAMKFTNFGTAMQTAGRQMQGFARGFNLYIAAPLAALGVGSYKAYTTFESAFAGVRKTVDATEETFTILQEGIIAMSETMPTSAAELAGIMEMAGQLGVPTDNLLEFTKTMAMLGESTNIDSKGGAADLARFMNITKSAWGETDKLGAVLVALGNNFATTESEILDMSTRLAAAGTLTGYSATQIMGLAAAMSSMGIEADAGGTAAGKLMKEMQLAAETGGEAADMFAKVMGTDAKGFAASFKTDAAQTMIDFFAGLASLDESGATSVVAMLDQMGITEVRMSNMVATGAANVELYSNATKMAAQAYDDGAALVEEASKRYATTESQDAMMYNKMENNMADLGENVAEAIKPAKEALDGLLESVKGMSEVDQQKIVNVMGALIISGAGLMAIGKTASAIGGISKGIGYLMEHKEGILTTLKGIGTSPIFGAVAAGAAIYALIAFLDSIPTDAEQILGSLANIQINVDEDSKNKTLQAIAEVKGKIDELNGAESTEFENTTAAVSAGYGTETMFGQAITYQKARAEKQISDLSGFYSKRINDLNRDIGEAVNNGDNATASSLAKTRDTLQNNWDKDVQAARDNYTSAISALVNGMMQAQPEAKAKLEKAAEDYDLIAQLEKVMRSKYDSYEDQKAGYSQFFTDAMLSRMTEFASPAMKNIIMSSTMDDIVMDPIEFYDLAKKMLMKSITDATSAANDGTLAYTLLDDLLSADGATDMLNMTQLQGALDGIVETLDFKQAAQKAIDNGNADLFGENLTQGLADGITTNTSTVSDTMNTVRDDTLTALRAAFAMHSPSRLMMGEGINIPAGLAEGITAGANLAYAAMAVMQTRLVSEAALTARMMSAAFAQNLNLSPTTSGISGGTTGGGNTNITFTGNMEVKSKTDAAVLASQIAALNRRSKAGYGS